MLDDYCILSSSLKELLMLKLISQQANVVCRQLGYTRAMKMHLGSHFGQVNGKFSLGMLKCVGNESSIGECIHLNLVDCKPMEVAGVTCASPLQASSAFPQCKYVTYVVL